MYEDIVSKFLSERYGLISDSVESVGSGTNKVFKVKTDKQNLYLRVSPRRAGYISAEIHWLEHLKNDLRVPEPMLSKRGKAIERIRHEGKGYSVCVFSEVEGKYWDKNDPAVWNEKAFYNWGKAIGKMHRLSKEYRPPLLLRRRKRFERNYNPLSNYRAVPKVQEKMAQIQAEITMLPKDRDSYGLIHCDMHQLNFLIGNDDIGVLDFDELQYGFFALDVGIALYHAIWSGIPDDVSGTDRNSYALGMIENFMSGYKTENTLSSFWLGKIPLFMRYRQIQALSWHIGVYKSNGFTAVVYNETLGIYFDFGQYIRDIENGVFFEGCTVDEGVFV